MNLPEARDWAWGAFSSSRWLLGHYRRFAAHLQEAHQIRNVIPFAPVRWHRGVQYFRARGPRDEDLFLKTDGIHQLLCCEIAAWRRLQGTGCQLSRFVPIYVCDMSGPYRFAAFEWVNGKSLASWLQRRVPIPDMEVLLSEMIGVLVDLAQARLVHRDFTPANLIVVPRPTDGRSQLRLIDFAFAVDEVAQPCQLDQRLPLSELRALAHGYKPGIYTWDDAFSCRTIVRAIAQSTGQRFPQVEGQLETRIGLHSYSLADDGRATPVER